MQPGRFAGPRVRGEEWPRPGCQPSTDEPRSRFPWTLPASLSMRRVGRAPSLRGSQFPGPTKKKMNFRRIPGSRDEEQSAANVHSQDRLGLDACRSSAGRGSDRCAALRSRASTASSERSGATLTRGTWWSACTVLAATPAISTSSARRRRISSRGRGGAICGQRLQSRSRRLTSSAEPSSYAPSVRSFSSPTTSVRVPGERARPLRAGRARS